MPVYNAEPFVERAIQSVIAQTYSDWEFLIVDDGSTDGTRSIIERIKDDRVILLSQINQGPFPARNSALKQARGEFIAFMDADDAWLPHKLERQLKLFTRPEIGLIFGDAIIVDYKDGKSKPRPRTYHAIWPPYKGWVFKNLLRYNFVPETSAIVRKTCLDALGPFSLKGTRSADYAKWVQIAMHYQLDYLNEPVFELTIHRESWSKNRLVRHLSQAQLFQELLEQASGHSQQIELQRFLFNLKWLILAEGHWPPKELSASAASVSVLRRFYWFAQFVYDQLVMTIRLSTQRIYMRKAAYPA